MTGQTLNPVHNPTLSSLAYFHSPGNEDVPASITMWLVADLTTPAAIATLHAAVAFLVDGPGSASCRLALVLNPSSPAPAPLLVRIVLAAAHVPSRRAKVLPFLLSLLGDVHAASGDEVALLAVALRHAEEAGLQTSWLKATLGELDSGVASPAQVKELERTHAAVVKYVVLGCFIIGVVLLLGLFV